MESVPDVFKDLAAQAEVQQLIAMALTEDLGERGDVTTRSLMGEEEQLSAVIVSRQSCRLAGQDIAVAVFKAIDAALEITKVKEDGEDLQPGDVCMQIQGAVLSVLSAERTALNFLQRLSGTATLTRSFTEIVKSYGTMILDTRKTTPGWRRLQKYAVFCGGGANHRMGLFDRVMLKDNHRNHWLQAGKGTLADAVAAARKAYPDLLVEIEVESTEDLQIALQARPDWVLLDNMLPEMMSDCVVLCDGRTRLEASGGITIENLEAVAATGVDAISLGCLTHSVTSVDLSLEIEKDFEK